LEQSRYRGNATNWLRIPKGEKMPPLNEQQQTFVNAILDRTDSINLVARAGCGKTYALVNGAVRVITENNLGSVALMAFNKSAANEFEHRIEALSKETQNSHLFEVETGTVHSFGFRFWRHHVLGKVKVDNYKVSNIVKAMPVAQDGYYKFLPQVSKLVSLAKQSVFTPDDLMAQGSDLLAHFDIDANGSEDEVIEVAADALRESNKQRQTIDFDDMIYLPVLNDVRVEQFDFVLIDEAQDTNPARRMLAFKMMKSGGRLIAVGDDKQAIYGFTGANSNSLELIKQALNSIELPLTITYRCPKAVVSEANRLVPDLVAHESAPTGVVRTIDSLIEVNE
jgi:superfamily I DNA/RNA helicase